MKTHRNSNTENLEQKKHTSKSLVLWEKTYLLIPIEYGTLSKRHRHCHSIQLLLWKPCVPTGYVQFDLNLASLQFVYLTLKAPNKNCSRRHFNLLLSLEENKA